MHIDAIKRLLANLAIILVRPKYPENIGAAARCAMNLGVTRLILVRDEFPDQDRMRQMATHHANSVIDAIEWHQDLASAVAPFAFLIGTTARKGRHRLSPRTPRDIVPEILTRLENNQVGLLFGPEDKGLANEDLNCCHMLTSIPTTEFSSLNLAQAVAIHCHEIFQGLLLAGDETSPCAPKIANTFELEGMYSHLQEILCRIGFLKEQDQDYWMRNIRNFFARQSLRAKEVRMIRGICRQFLWYEDGKKTDSVK